MNPIDITTICKKKFKKPIAVGILKVSLQTILTTFD